MSFQDIGTAPLTAAAFAPFGHLVAADLQLARPVNAGTAERIDLDDHLGHATGAILPTLAIYRCRPQPSPVIVPLLERHPLSSQTFLALRVARWLIVVAPAAPDGSPDPAAALAFVDGAGIGITYAAGVWHSPLIALDQPAELAMLMWEAGGSADCEFASLPDSVRVQL